jgi:hypothetical protein
MSEVTGTLLGSWYAAPEDGGGTDEIVLTFLANGTFFVADKGTVANDPNGTSGVEWGSYTWDESTGAFSASLAANTDGEWGMSHAGEVQLRAVGNVLTLIGSEGSMELARLVSVPPTILGSWYASFPNDGDQPHVQVTFLADGTYMLVSAGLSPGPDAHTGLEWGQYTWNQGTGAFTSSASINTDDQWGFSHAGITNIQVSGDQITLTDSFGTFQVGRVPNGQSTSAHAGTGAAETILGTAGADTLIGLGANDTLDGGAGIDTAVYATVRSNYTLTQAVGGFTVQAAAGAEGTDSLTAVERLSFSDAKVALDIDGNAGMAVKMLGAVAGAGAAASAYYVGLLMSYLDAGVSHEVLMQGVLDVVLGPGATDEAVVTLLYTHIAGAAPGAQTVSFLAGLINDRGLTQAEFGVLAAEHDANLANVNIVGLAATGVEYI